MKSKKKKIMKPRITVVIPTYNEEYYVGDLLKSIKKQSYADYEILGVDSYSKDRTVSILKRYGAKVVKMPKKNVASAYNRGIKASKGDIVALVDADYILSSKLFERIIKDFDSDPNIVCIEPTITVRSKDIPKKERKKFIAFNKLVMYLKRASYYTATPFAYGCVFIRRKALIKAGLFNEDIDVDENWEFYPRLRKLGKFKIVENTAQMSYRRLAAEGILKSCLMYLTPAIPIAIHNRFKWDFKAIRKGKVID
ncbi:MAG: glycosyltransferase [Candidatus Parvarchaeota archaeon]